MPSINNIDSHSIEMRTLANCSLDTFVVLEAVKVQLPEELPDDSILIEPVLLTETVRERNTLDELVEFCRSQYDRDEGFRAGFDDGVNSFFYCCLPSSKFEKFAVNHPALRGFLESLAGLDYNTVYVNFPEKQKIKYIGTVLNKNGKKLNLAMEKFTAKDGAKFSLYPITEFGFNETRLSYIIDRIDNCTFEQAENTTLVNRIRSRIQDDLDQGTGALYTDEIENNIEHNSYK